jgi:hypothetical protein
MTSAGRPRRGGAASARRAKRYLRQSRHRRYQRSRCGGAPGERLQARPRARYFGASAVGYQHGWGPSDAELVQRVGDADGAALSQLYQRFVRPCYSLARRICADEGLAEEVVQEVFLTLWRNPSRFDP